MEVQRKTWLVHYKATPLSNTNCKLAATLNSSQSPAPLSPPTANPSTFSHFPVPTNLRQVRWPDSPHAKTQTWLAAYSFCSIFGEHSICRISEPRDFVHFKTRFTQSKMYVHRYFMWAYTNVNKTRARVLHSIHFPSQLLRHSQPLRQYALSTARYSRGQFFSRHLLLPTFSSSR